MTPFIVKKAVSSGAGHPGEPASARTREARHRRDAEPVEHADRRPSPAATSSTTVPRWKSRAPRKTPRSPKRVATTAALLAVDLDVEQRVEEVEAGNPERDRAAQRPRLPGNRPGDRRPGADRREPVDRAEPEVAEPGPALQVRVDHEAGDRDRPEPVDERVELEDRHEEDGERRDAEEHHLRGESRPLGSSRRAVRGLRASSPASISRLSPIASERAPTIATVIQSRSCALGTALTARNAPT